MSNDSKNFQESMSLFLRSSPLVHHTPEKCDECIEFHIIADDLVYCAICHHPMPSRRRVEHSGIHQRPNVEKPTLIRRLLAKVASR